MQFPVSATGSRDVPLTMPTTDLLTEPDQAIIITPGEHPIDSDARFQLSCQLNPDSKVEMDAEGRIIVTPGNSEDSAYRSGEAFRQLANWARQDGSGRAFDSTTNFNLPSGAKRQPDAAWVPKTVLEQEGVASLRTTSKPCHVPVFLIEVTSPSDKLADQMQKCSKWIEAGVQELVLLHPDRNSAWVYRSSGAIEEIPQAKQVISRVLPGFVLDCTTVWEDLF